MIAATPIDYDQKEFDYKKLIESDLSTNQVKEQVIWFADRLTTDINVPVRVEEGYVFPAVRGKAFMA